MGERYVYDGDNPTIDEEIQRCVSLHKKMAWGLHPKFRLGAFLTMLRYYLVGDLGSKAIVPPNPYADNYIPSAGDGILGVVMKKFLSKELYAKYRYRKAPKLARHLLDILRPNPELQKVYRQERYEKEVAEAKKRRDMPPESWKY